MTNDALQPRLQPRAGLLCLIASSFFWTGNDGETLLQLEYGLISFRAGILMPCSFCVLELLAQTCLPLMQRRSVQPLRCHHVSVGRGLGETVPAVRGKLLYRHHGAREPSALEVVADFFGVKWFFASVRRKDGGADPGEWLAGQRQG